MQEQTRKTAAVILAAGKGTRMKSDLPKVLHPLLGKPMVSYIADSCKKAGIDQVLLVIGHQADLVKETLGDRFDYAEQKQQLGTGHAFMVAANSMKNFQGDVLVLAGDTPFLTPDILKELIHQHQKNHAAATFMTADLDPTPPYGRIIRNPAGKVQSIVEDRDCTPEQKAVKEVNTSHYCFQSETVFPLLNLLDTDNDQGEYYLTDIIKLLVERDERVETHSSDDPDVLLGINSKKDLSISADHMRKNILEGLMDEGVTFVNPDQVYVEADVKIGRDSVIYPFTSLTGDTTIGSGCHIGPQVRLLNCQIGDESRIEFAVIENREIVSRSELGPFVCMTGDVTKKQTD